MLLRKEERDFLLRQKVRNEKNLRISYVVFKCNVLITGYHNFKDFYSFFTSFRE